jgi:UDPglucose 6-dehydrogenase
MLSRREEIAMSQSTQTKLASSMERISFFGLGRVGLTTAVCSAKKGYHVIGIDKDENKVRLLQEGKAPFFEPKLQEYVNEVIHRRTMRASTDPKLCCDSDVIFVTVNTPSKDDGSIDLSQVQTACTTIGHAIKDNANYQLIVVRSTVTPGTTRIVLKPLIEKSSGRTCGTQLGLCFNPEFLREGRAIEDTENPDRVVIGSDEMPASEKLAMVWQRFLPNLSRDRLILTTPENAEFIKYGTNTFLATKISLINTIATIAERLPGADITTIARGIGLDPRVGSQFLRAGLGWGGSCLPKDLRALAAFSRLTGYKADLVEQTIEVNSKQPGKAVEFARQSLGTLNGRVVAILGLSFKPDTDDVREAVSISIVNQLLQAGARVIAYDPIAAEAAKQILGERIQYARSVQECLRDAELAILVTEWDELKKLKPEDFRALMKRPILYDGRRIFDATEMVRAGIQFGAVGLGH